jgi:hypothetical protein
MPHITTRTVTKARIAGTLLSLMVPGWFYGNSGDVRGQECSPAEVIEAVRSGVKVPSARIPLTVTELTTMRERVIALEQENHGDSAELQAVRFYEVRPSTYEFVNGRFSSLTVQLDGEAVWVVGVGPSKTIYKLAGFSNSVSDFNRLMRDLAIHVKGPEDALGVFDIFARLSQPPDFFPSVVGDAMQLQGVALQDFRLRFSQSARIAAYERWWRTMSLQVKKTIVPPKVQSRQSNFEVSYYRYSEGVVKRETVLISGEGAIGPEASSKTLYRN